MYPTTDQKQKIDNPISDEDSYKAYIMEYNPPTPHPPTPLPSLWVARLCL